MSLLRTSLLIATAAALMAACSTTSVNEHEVAAKKLNPGQASLILEATSFDKLPAMEDSDWEPALSAFKESCKKMLQKKGWQDVCVAANGVMAGEAKNFFTANFVPYQTISVKRNNDLTIHISDSGLMTGYYEPILYGSRKKKSPYIHPLHTMPKDLITVDLSGLYPQLKGLRLRGQLEGNKLVPYDTRAELSHKSKKLDQYAIAWVEDPVAAFFLQIQGSGRIVLPDGSYMRVGYGDVNGHPYQGIGNYLVRKGYLKSHELSMQSIRSWAKKNPQKVQDVLNQNPSYVFFVERVDQKPEEGPLGAQGVPLTEQGSVAVDRRYYEMGWPLVVDVTQANPELKFTKAVIAQDTGGAIKGPIRYDFFWGSGDDAGNAAGRQRSQVKSWVLLPHGVKPPKSK